VRKVVTRTTACGSHHTSTATLTATGCSSHPTAVGVVQLLEIMQSHPSRLNYKPQPWLNLLQMPKSWGMVKLFAYFQMLIFLRVWLMIFQFDSCRKGKILVICIFGKLLIWGNGTL
jgi:hypothetical protein